MSLFNEYGNPPLDGEFISFIHSIFDTVSKKASEWKSKGTSVVEMRAAEQILTNAVSLAIAEVILSKQIKDREKSQKIG